jgi:hypothetical protein
MAEPFRRRIRPDLVKSVSFAALNLLATLHVVWFYLSRTPSYLDLKVFENGKEQTPFQYRLLMMRPLAWAHHSTKLTCLAARISLLHVWFPTGVSAEGFVQAAVDVPSVVIAGLVARELYRRTSPTGILTSWMYPLALLLVLSTYALPTIHVFRFVYDLPSLAFFSLGLLLIYTRAHPLLLAAVFLLGTMNRETTLLLLPFFVLAQCSRGKQWDFRRLYSKPVFQTSVPLLVTWLLWHLWVVHHFRANPSAAGPRFWVNLGTLLIPLAWPQLLMTCMFPMLFVFTSRRHIRDSILRSWVWALPIWFACMLHYGLLVESRIFGELISYLACASALIAEDKVLLFLENHRRSRATPDAEQFPLRGTLLREVDSV